MQPKAQVVQQFTRVAGMVLAKPITRAYRGLTLEVDGDKAGAILKDLESGNTAAAARSIIQMVDDWKRRLSGGASWWSKDRNISLRYTEDYQQEMNGDIRLPVVLTGMVDEEDKHPDAIGFSEEQPIPLVEGSSVSIVGISVRIPHPKVALRWWNDAMQYAELPDQSKILYPTQWIDLSVSPMQITAMYGGKPLYHVSDVKLPSSGSIRTVAGLSLENLVSVAEQAMERGGFVGKTIHMPMGHRDDPAFQAASAPVNEWAQKVVGQYVNVYTSAYTLGQNGNPIAMLNGNSIVVRETTNEMIILHELAHLISNTEEGYGGHSQHFCEVARGLYGKYISPEAGEVFWGIVGPSVEKTSAFMDHREVFYHASQNKMPIGTVLVPQGEGSRTENFDYEGDMPGQRGWVYMAKTPDEAVLYGALSKNRRGSLPLFIYEVQPLGEVEADPETWDDDILRVQRARVTRRGVWGSGAKAEWDDEQEDWRKVAQALESHQGFVDRLRKEHPGAILDVADHPTHISVDRIVIPKESRGKGEGSAIMDKIIDRAEKAKKPVTLTPSGDFGGSKTRLVKWYRGMGFQKNYGPGRGRLQESSDSMVRHPKQAGWVTAKVAGGISSQVKEISLMSMEPDDNERFRVFVDGYMEDWTLNRIKEAVANGAVLKQWGKSAIIAGVQLPPGYRINHAEHGMVRAQDGSLFFSGYWVVLGPLDPNREDQDDFTKPDATYHYHSKSGLLAAIENGSAWLAGMAP